MHFEHTSVLFTHYTRECKACNFESCCGSCYLLVHSVDNHALYPVYPETVRKYLRTCRVGNVMNYVNTPCCAPMRTAKYKIMLFLFDSLLILEVCFLVR
jgi:hypothetical protein